MPWHDAAEFCTATHAIDLTIRSLHEHQSTKKSDEKYRRYDHPYINKFFCHQPLATKHKSTTLPTNTTHWRFKINVTQTFLLPTHDTLSPYTQNRREAALQIAPAEKEGGEKNEMQTKIYCVARLYQSEMTVNSSTMATAVWNDSRLSFKVRNYYILHTRRLFESVRR